MQIRYVDAHCHIQFEQYTEDDIELIEKMREEGVAGIVVGVDNKSSEEAVVLTKEHEHLYAAVGLHPNRIAEGGYDISYCRTLAQDPKVVAIGECGVDYYRLPADESASSAEATKAKQKEIFKEHIALAVELDKPLIIHARPSSAKATEGKPGYDAYWDLITILKEAKSAHGENLRGDVHFFVGGVPEAEALIALGFTISFTAVITFARDYDEVIRTVPLSSILSETDAPYVAPASRRGKRNDPLAAMEVVAKIAEVKNEPLETVREALLSNSQRLFQLPLTK